jgi:glycosyltransferase involved in cell wall biosynthesis
MTVQISIITATLNARELLPGLIQSLQQQTDSDFEWMVMDGGSRDGTLELLRSAGLRQIRVVSEPDCGIYDALNKAIQLSSGTYYLVCGADDRLSEEAVARYKSLATESSAELISARVLTTQGTLNPERGKPWLRGHLAFVSQHAVGTLIKKDLHKAIGFYSRRFKIAADQLFIKQACSNKQVRLLAADFIAGRYATDGVSGGDVVTSMTEFFRVQLETESNKPLQILLFCLRLFKHRKRLVASADGKFSQ